MTDDQLMDEIEHQYRAIIQMNKLLNQMTTEAVVRGFTSQLFAMQTRVDALENVSARTRPPLVI